MCHHASRTEILKDKFLTKERHFPIVERCRANARRAQWIGAAKGFGEAEIESSGVPGAMESEQGEFLPSVAFLFSMGLSIGNLGAL